MSEIKRKSDGHPYKPKAREMYLVDTLHNIEWARSLLTKEEE